MKQKKIVIAFFILLVLILNLSLGLTRLSHYSAVDEPYWIYKRIPKYWKAIKEQKWRHTNINDKPGITVALISGIGLFSVNPLPYKSLRQEVKTPTQTNYFSKINFSLRLPIYLATIIFLLIFFLLLQKLFNTSVALTALTFIGLSPIILGMSLIINPDSLLWGFLPLSILSYLIHQKEKQSKKYLYLTGIFLGLALLTKYVANILYVYFLGLIFLEYIYYFQKKKPFFNYLKKALLDFSFIIAISMAVFFLLFPATWKHSEILLKGTLFSKAFKSTWPIFIGFFALLLADLGINKSRLSSLVMNFLTKYRDLFQKIIGGLILIITGFIFYNIFTGMTIWNFEAIMASPKGGSGFALMDFISKVIADLYALIFGLTPLVFIFFIYSIFKNSFLKNSKKEKFPSVLYFLLFILLYYIASTINHVTDTVRYQIVLYPLASIIAAIGFYQFIETPFIKKYLRFYSAYLIIIALSFFSLYSVKPFYLTYASSILPSRYILNFKDMGDGSFQIAQELNKLPQAQKLIIWSDKGAVCESFIGRCITGFHKNDLAGVHFNYLIVSTGRKSKSLKSHSLLHQQFNFTKIYSSSFPGYKMIILGGRPNNFVKIVSVNKEIAK